MGLKTFNDWLIYATAKLQKAGIASAHLDALILLEDATSLDRAHLLAHPEKLLTEVLNNSAQGPTLSNGGNRLPADGFELLNLQLNQRIMGEPLAYIRGFVEFYGHKFFVNHDVLVPRPESEAFLHLLVSLEPKKGQSLIDIGTGSGALAISAKLAIPHLVVYATDISAKALKVAKTNANTLGVDVKFEKANLLSKQTKPIDYILANLPYVPKNYKVTGVDAEPKNAIFANENGLALIRKLSLTAYKLLNYRGYVLIESLKAQHDTVCDIYTKVGLDLVGQQGLVQVFQKIKLANS